MAQAQHLDDEVEEAFRQAIRIDEASAALLNSVASSSEPTALPDAPPSSDSPLNEEPPEPDPSEEVQGVATAYAKMAEDVTVLVERERMRFDETLRQQREMLALQREHYSEFIEIQRRETERVAGLLEQFGVIDLAIESPLEDVQTGTVSGSR